MSRHPCACVEFKSLGYDAATKTLEIEFPRGGVYRYRGVSQSVASRFMMAEDMAAHFRTYIKPNYECLRATSNGWVGINATKASPQSLQFVRSLAKRMELFADVPGEYIAPMWRPVVEACGHQYPDACRMTVEDWLATLTQTECSRAIEFLKARRDA